MQNVWQHPAVPITEEDTRIYSEGRCGDLAVALYELTLLPIFGMGWSRDGVPAHIFVRYKDFKLDVWGLMEFPFDAEKLHDGSPEGVLLAYGQYKTDAHTYGIARTLLERIGIHPPVTSPPRRRWWSDWWRSLAGRGTRPVGQ